MFDMKYSNSHIARKYSKARDYVEVNFAAVKEMHQQVGNLQLDENGIAQGGLLVRHLVLPGALAGAEAVAAFLVNDISTNAYL